MISVVIPVYNLEKYIKTTLDSILAQDVSDMEIVLVDDLSSDSSTEVIREYADAHPDACIRLFEPGKKLKACGARNYGIKMAQGRYIAFLDGDDLWMKDKISKQLSFMEKTGCGFSFTGYEFADETGRPMGKIVKVPKLITYHQALRNTTIFTSTVIFDTDIVKKSDIVFPDILSEDTALWFKLLRLGYRCCGLNENLTLYRRTGNSLSSDKSDAARRIWNLYRKSEHLPVLYSAWCFAGWGFNAVKRRI
ncbi:MAG: glycosyltransferase family 2 protein [Lachnospiraceae bacterium]|nr:glycosyltransferase family 2 protein [Lachnospiraceae bacterium]